MLKKSNDCIGMFHSICAQWIVSFVWRSCSCTCQFEEEWNVHKTPCFECHQPCHAVLAMKNSAIWLNLSISLSFSGDFRFYNDLLYSAAFLLLLSKCRLSDRVGYGDIFKLKRKSAPTCLHSSFIYLFHFLFVCWSIAKNFQVLWCKEKEEEGSML